MLGQFTNLKLVESFTCLNSLNPSSIRKEPSHRLDFVIAVLLLCTAETRVGRQLLRARFDFVSYVVSVYEHVRMLEGQLEEQFTPDRLEATTHCILMKSFMKRQAFPSRSDQNSSVYVEHTVHLTFGASFCWHFPLGPCGSRPLRWICGSSCFPRMRFWM